MSAERSPVTGPAAGAATATVLVVDDDASVRAFFGMALELGGFDVVHASDGEQALRTLSTGTVDAVLLDSSMPLLDGAATLAAIRANPSTRLVPVLMVTGAAGVQARILGLDAGADDYLAKPIDADELVARVRAHLRGRGAWRRVAESQRRGRATVAQELSHIRQGTAEETADAVCRSLAKLADDTAAVVVAFSSDASATTLAVHGAFEHLRPGVTVRAPLARRLYQQALSGPWVEDQTEHSTGSWTPVVPDGLAACAFAPLRSEGRLLAVLGLGVGGHSLDESGEDPGGRNLSAVTDFASLVSALLAPGLMVASKVRARRQQVHEIIAQRGFVPVFQPIVELASGGIVGYEALTRFDDGTPPERKFAEAAEVGLAMELETVTAAAAVRAGRRLPSGAWLSINVSPAFVADAERIADAVGDPERTLVLELTEHDPIDDYPAVLAAVDELSIEVRLSVDDAGAGYACLHHILALRPDYVKLDRSWVSGVDTDPVRQALVSGILAVAEQTGGELIAEGIEAHAERDALLALDVALGQGYLLGPPGPPTTR